MPLIRVFGNTYVDTSWIGKVEHEATFPKGKRVSVTTIFNHTGKDELAKFTTEISTEMDNPDKNALKRDNFLHEEVIRAIRLGVDARQFEESTS